MKKNLPNIVTVFGLFLTILSGVLWLHEPCWFAVVLCTIGRVLDLADGVVARRLKAVSQIGKWLDPLSDKLGIYFILAILLPDGVNPWILAAAAGLDYASTALRVAGISSISAKTPGKLKTTLQSLSLATFPVATLTGTHICIFVGNGLLIVAVAFAVFSIWQKSGNLANFLTCCNAVSGALAIVAAGQHCWWLFSSLVIAAAIFDVADGIIARRSGNIGSSGALLDDFSDALSFGIAPAVAVWSYCHIEYPIAGIGISMIYFFTVVIRLVHFTKHKGITPKGFFDGVPSPAGAGLAGFAILPEWPVMVVLLITVGGSVLMATFKRRWPHFGHLFHMSNDCILWNGCAIIIGALITTSIFSLSAVPFGIIVAYLFTPLWNKPDTETAT